MQCRAQRTGDASSLPSPCETIAMDWELNIEGAPTSWLNILEVELLSNRGVKEIQAGHGLKVTDSQRSYQDLVDFLE